MDINRIFLLLRRKFLFLMTLVVTLIYLPVIPIVHAEKDEKSLLGFAHHLFERGHYYQAVTEYERFIYFNPDHPSVAEARLKIAFCYKLGEQYTKAVELFRKLIDEYFDQEYAIVAAFNVGECFRLNGDYEQALAELREFVENYPGHPLADKAQWNSAWIYIEMEEYPSAQERLFLVREGSTYQIPAQELAGALEELPHLPRKSPRLAGFLAAVLPGSGHLYTGEKKQALFSFVTNALLIFGTYEAFNNELYVAGGFLSLFAVNYYSGNIFGALNSAHKYNRRVKEAFLEGYKQKYELSINLRGGGITPLLEFALRF
ncbi:MAG: tetratricopeptide repeat protein [Thermodesulfobacteriota bacterium]|nr:tetratricopeptide repeat protein [Thermodesulfobacteriota bacterium]